MARSEKNAAEYGPVPISRLKEESSRVFSALEAGRRVLISRHGRVVASIEPADQAGHADLLAGFAVGVDVGELTSTQISQGSPSAAVHEAEQGGNLLVTRNNKVYGVLGPATTSMDLEGALRQEQMLSELEAQAPLAPEQLALASRITAEAVADRSGEISGPTVIKMDASPDEVKVFTMLYKGTLLRDVGDPSWTTTTYQVVSEFKGHQDPGIRSKVALAFVQLADWERRQGTARSSKKAMALIDDALDILEVDASPSGTVPTRLDWGKVSG